MNNTFDQSGLTNLSAAAFSMRCSCSVFCTGRLVNVEGGTWLGLVGGGTNAELTWKKGYCRVWDAVGRCCGSYFIKSWWEKYEVISCYRRSTSHLLLLNNWINTCISVIASAEALGMIWARGVGTNCGKRKFIWLANLIPSGQVRCVGDPMIEQIL